MTLEKYRADVERLELERSKIEGHRFSAQGELRRLSIALDKNRHDGNAIFEQSKLNKTIEADSTKLCELQRDLRMAERQLELAFDQQKMKDQVAHSAATADLPRDKWFELQAPDGRVVRVKHSTAENCKKDAASGYVFVGEVFGCDAEGRGAISAPQGDQLVAYLESRGAVFIKEDLL